MTNKLKPIQIIDFSFFVFLILMHSKEADINSYQIKYSNAIHYRKKSSLIGLNTSTNTPSSKQTTPCTKFDST